MIRWRAISVLVLTGVVVTLALLAPWDAKVAMLPTAQ